MRNTAVLALSLPLALVLALSACKAATDAALTLSLVMLAVSVSSSQMVPEVGSIIRLIMRSDVVLPHPDGPTSTVILPEGASSSSVSTATVPSG